MQAPCSPLIAISLLLCPPGPAVGAEITACVIAGLQGNPAYYSNATTATRLQCELNAKDYYPTLIDLYKQGWRLLQVIGGEHAMSLGNGGPSPLYLLEREAVPAAAPAVDKPAPSPEQAPEKPAAKKR